MKEKWKRTMGAAALSAMALGAIAPPAFAFGVDGQILDRGRFPRTYSVAGTGQKVTCPGPECTPEFINDAVQRDVMTPKEATKIRKLQSKPQARANSGGTSGWVIPVAGALAVGAGVLAVTSGDNNPASPN